MLQKVTILGVDIANESEKNISEYLIERIKQKKKSFLITPNPEILVYASKHPQYQKLLTTADIALPDGVGIIVAARLLGYPLKQRITGVDFIETLCRVSQKKPLSMGFLGGRGGVAERAAVCLKRKYPWINPVWVGEEWSEENGWVKEISSDMVRYTFGVGPVGRYSTPVSLRSQATSLRSGPHPTSSASPAGARRGSPSRATHSASHHIDILFVAFGFPKQEEWITKTLASLPVTAAMGVGGAFDYLSEEVIRAPRFMRSIGLEWLFRLLRQPWRIKRQMALATFVLLIVKEFFSQRRR